MDFSLVLPALNEEKKIRRDIEAGYRFIISRGLDAEIIVVADGSTDRTVAEAMSALSEIPILRVLPLTDQRGKGAAIKRGFAEARGSFVMFADAGLCVPFENASLGIELLRKGVCDIAMGSRSHPQTVLVRVQPLWRRWGSRAFRCFIASFMGVPWSFGDTQCGFKLYRREVADTLYSELFTPGYMFDIEVILRARAHGYRIRQFPVTWSNDADSRYQALSGTLQVFKQLFEMRLRLASESIAQRTRSRARMNLQQREHAPHSVATQSADPLAYSDVAAGSENA